MSFDPVSIQEWESFGVTHQLSRYPPKKLTIFLPMSLHYLYLKISKSPYLAIVLYLAKLVI